MTEFKSIQELLNALYSCIAIDDKGNAYLRTNSSGVTPDPGPDPGPTPTFTQVGTQYEDASKIYSQYLRNANLLGIHCQMYESGSGSFSNELGDNVITTINFSGTGVDDLVFADVGVKNENGIIYLQNADTLKWLKPSTFEIKCGHLIAIKKLNAGEYTSPDYVAPHIIIGDPKDDGYGDLLGKLSSLIPGIRDYSETIYYNIFEGMFATSPRLVNVNAYYPYIIGQNVYRRMFADCPILNTANLYISDKPQMTTECIGFAESIFDGCINLSKLNDQIKCAEIPAAKMFANAFNNTQVTSLTIEAQSISDFYKVEDLDYPLYNWLGGASNRQGTIRKPYALTLTENSDSGIPTNWTVINTSEPPTPPEPEKPDLDKFDPAVPLCIENTTDIPVEICMCNVYDTHETPMAPEIPARGNCKISYDLAKWENYNFVLKPDTDINKTEDLAKITLKNKGDRVYIKADKLETALNTDIFLSTIIKVINPSAKPRIRVGGNIASWNKGSNDSYINDYLEMNSKDSYCYQYMFKDCDCLVRAPELPATTLAGSCYLSMFEGCTSLTQAPELPATTLAENCYNSMFRGCAKLNYVKCLATNITITGCVSYWLYGVSSTGDFYTSAATNWTTGTDGIPSGWTRHDIA